jgi:hypothetical protein
MAFATANVVGGYAVTDRMLRMFRPRTAPPAAPPSATVAPPSATAAPPPTSPSSPAAPVKAAPKVAHTAAHRAGGR